MIVYRNQFVLGKVYSFKPFRAALALLRTKTTWTLCGIFFSCSSIRIKSALRQPLPKGAWVRRQASCVASAKKRHLRGMG